MCAYRLSGGSAGLSISTKISSSSIRFRRTDADEIEATQVPQPSQSTSLISVFILFSPETIWLGRDKEGHRSSNRSRPSVFESEEFGVEGYERGEACYSTVSFVPCWPWLDKRSIRSLRISRIALRNSTREFAKCCRTAGEIPRNSRTVSTTSRHGQGS